MAYKLKFHDPILFRLCYDGFHMTGRATTREEHLLSNRVLDRLEKISRQGDGVVPGFDPADPAAPSKREVIVDMPVVFEDTEFNYLRATLNKIQGPPAISRRIEDLYKLLDNAQHGDSETLLGLDR